MAVTLADVETQARELPAEERARLVELLLESLRQEAPGEIELAWEAEVAERVAAFDRGESTTYSADEVFAEVQRLAR
jgi:putative addiction module component (TIGR02574 family)